jgi:hypothetical protein
MCRAAIPYIPLPADLPAGAVPVPVVDAPNIWNQRVEPDGRRNDPDRPQRAIDGFNNLPARRQAQALFRQARDNGTIPQNAMFGGIHQRKCGTCDRRHGANGVRFLKLPDGTRKYRCERCYMAAYAAAGQNGAVPPAPPEWSMNGVALAAYQQGNQ